MTNAIRHFVKLESASGILLIVATILALVWANTPFSTAYQAFINLPVAVQVASLTLNKPLLLWINDGMMAIFFLVVGLEVKRELMMGALASRAQALFPAIAALGGMVMPALIYLYFNGNHEVARQGWAIPVATDIAFSLGVMALLGKRVPTTLKVFLLALAIIDDLGAILIITLFYTHQLSLNALVVAGGSIALLAYLNRSGVSRISPYILVGVLLWFSLLHSGIHATLAGVITGFFIPLYGQDAKIAPLQRLEHKLHPWVAYLILPLFAFANAGVSLQGLSLAKLSASLPLGVVLGLFIGKPLGIFSFSWLSVQLNLTKLPSGTSFPLIFGVSVFCGIGFTMSMFIAALAFEDATTEYAMCARLGILMGSTMAAVIGYWLLHYMLPRQEH